MRFVDEDQGQRGQRGQSDAAPAAGRRQPAQAAGSREEGRCQRESSGIGACLRAPAGSRFGKVRNSPSSSRNTTPAACTLSRVRVHAAAQTSARQCGAGDQARARPPGRQVRLGSGGAGPRQQKRARPASGGCRRGAGGRRECGSGATVLPSTRNPWWSGARSCGRAKFTPAPRRRGCRFSPEWIAWLCPARPRHTPCPAFEPPPRPWRPDAGCRGCAAAGDEPTAKLQVGKREFVQTPGRRIAVTGGSVLRARPAWPTAQLAHLGVLFEQAGGIHFDDQPPGEGRPVAEHLFQPGQERVETASPAPRARRAPMCAYSQSSPSRSAWISHSADRPSPPAA